MVLTGARPRYEGRLCIFRSKRPFLAWPEPGPKKPPDSPGSAKKTAPYLEARPRFWGASSIWDPPRAAPTGRGGGNRRSPCFEARGVGKLSLIAFYSWINIAGPVEVARTPFLRGPPLCPACLLILTLRGAAVSARALSVLLMSCKLKDTSGEGFAQLSRCGNRRIQYTS